MMSATAAGDAEHPTDRLTSSIVLGIPNVPPVVLADDVRVR